MNFRFKYCFLLFLFALQACTGSYYLKDTQTSQTRIKQDSLQLVDSSLVRMIAPYKQKLDAQMNEVLNVSDMDLLKERPEGTLCNFAADAILSYGNKIHDKPIDFCLLNYGGLRVPSIAKGNITLGKIYELMPFDNLVEVVEIDGASCKQLLDVIAKSGGWPVSGVRFKINNMIAEDIFIKGQTFDINKTYTIITSDYLVNGGDGLDMLKKAAKKTPLNYKVRDAIIDYVRDQKNNNQNINTQLDGRITIVQPEKIH